MRCGLQYSDRSHEQEPCKWLIYSASLLYSCVYDVFKVHQSYHIKEQFGNVNWVRISQQTWPQDQDNLNGHMCWAYAYSQEDARVCTCIDAVNVHGCVKEAQSRKEENRFDWLILVCDVQPWLLSHLQWHLASMGLNHWWDVCACIGIRSHTRVNLSVLLNRVMDWIDCRNQVDCFELKEKNKNTEHWYLNGTFSNLASEWGSPFICIPCVTSAKVCIVFLKWIHQETILLWSCHPDWLR
jgi:hypothetical protein